MRISTLPWKAVLSLGLVASSLTHDVSDRPTTFQTSASEALASPSPLPEAYNALWTRTDSSSNDTDDDWICSANCSLCVSNGLTEPSNSTSKRSDDDDSTLSLDLFGRALPSPSGNYATWLYNQLKAATLVPKGVAPGISTSSVVRVSGSAAKVGVINLYGCTSVVVVSKNAIYASHLYQTWFAVGTTASIDQFQSYVINWLKNDPNLNNPSFTDCDANTKAFIITPGRTDGRNPLPGIRYQARVNEISSALNSFLPLAADATQQSYVNVKKAEKSGESMSSGFDFPQGKVLVAYDPNNNGGPAAAVWTGDSTSPIGGVITL